MKVQFHSEQILAGKAYAAGSAQISDKHAHSHEFKYLVKAGHVTVHPRTEAEQKLQAHKDQYAAKKAAQAHAASIKEAE